MLRKLNTYLSLFTSLFFTVHLGIMCLLLSGAIPYNKGYRIGGILLIITFIMHAALSMLIFFLNTENNSKGTLYVQNNKTIIIQRIIAIILLFMAAVHIRNGSGIPVFQVVFAAAANAHIALSLPKAFITLGVVDSMKTYKKAQIISAVFGIALTLWTGVSYGIYAMAV